MKKEIETRFFNDGSSANVITFVKEEYDEVLPLIRSTWQNTIESTDYETYLYWKSELDKLNSILFKAVDKTRRHTRQTSEQYKMYRKTLPSYKNRITGGKGGRPKIRDENYWKEYQKNYYYNVIKPNRKLARQNKSNRI